MYKTGGRRLIRGVQDKHLILELSVLVLTEESGSHTGESLGLEQTKTLLKGVVDVDSAGRVDDGHTTGSGRS